MEKKIKKLSIGLKISGLLSFLFPKKKYDFENEILNRKFDVNQVDGCGNVIKLIKGGPENTIVADAADPARSIKG